MINVVAVTWTLAIILFLGILAVTGWGIVSECAAGGGDDGNLLLDLSIQSDDSTLVMARYDTLFPPGMAESRT